MRSPGSWWIFQPRGSRRPRLTPLGVAWTAAAYLLVGLVTALALPWLAAWDPSAGPVLLVLLASAGWTGWRIAVDGRFLRGAAWLTGAGWQAVVHLLTAPAVCGTLIFGGGLSGVSPGIAPCLPHQDFMVTLFVAAWTVAGPAALVGLSSLELLRWLWLRRDPLHAFRLLTES